MRTSLYIAAVLASGLGLFALPGCSGKAAPGCDAAFGCGPRPDGPVSEAAAEAGPGCEGSPCIKSVDLVAYWKLDDGSGTKAADSSESNHPLTLSGAASWTAGKKHGALALNGVDAYGETGFGEALPNWTVSTWVSAAAAPGSTKDTGPVMKEENFIIAWDHTSEQFRGAAGLSAGGKWHAASFGPLSANTWYHLAATFDGKTLKAYRDGQLVTSTVVSAPADNVPSHTLRVGRHSVKDAYFAGTIDETRIFRRALSDAEVLALYKELAGTTTGATFTVDPKGSDASGDGSAAKPWASLSHACASVAKAGSTISLRAGTYAEQKPCNLAVGVSIAGAGKDLTTITSSYSGFLIVAESGSLVDGNNDLGGFTILGGASPDKRELDGGILIKRRNRCAVHDVKLQNIEHPAGFPGGAIELYTDIDWSSGDSETPPAAWMTGCTIYNVEIHDCADVLGGDNTQGAITINGQADLVLRDSIVDESHTKGQTVKGVYGWLKHIKVYGNTFRVAPQSLPRQEFIIFEVWNVSGDSEIYNNKFYDGYLSFVSGQKLGGTYSFTFHDNQVYNSLTNEFSADDIVIHNNYFTGAYSGKDGGGVALWQTWASAKNEIHNWTVRNNVFYDVHASAVTVLDKGAGVTFSGIRVLNNVIDGVAVVPWGGTAVSFSASGGSKYSNIQIENNLIMNTAAWAVASTGPLDTVQVRNNLFWSTTAGTVNLPGASGLTVQSNTTAAPGIVGVGQRPDPFYRPASATSNLVDKGVDVGLPFKGTAPDIGPYEW